MFLNLSTLALVLCVVGILLMRLEFPAVAGPVYASGAQERWGVKLLIPLLVIAGLALPIHSFAHVTYFTIRSGGQTMITFLFDAVYTWVVTVLLAFVLSFCG